jgi:hypothetical protein
VAEVSVPDSDWEGWRLIGSGSNDDISDAIACVQVYFELLNLNWQSDRVLKYLKSVGELQGKAIPNKHYLSVESYKILSKKLKESYER